MDKIIISLSAVAFILLIILAAYLWKKKYLRFTDDNIILIMSQSREYFYIGIAGIIFFGSFAVYFIVDLSIFAFLCFYFIVLFNIYICIIGVLWRGVLTTDAITFYTPFLPVKKIKMHEITSVKYTENRTGAYGTGRKVLEGYHQQKKLFYVDESCKGFEFLHYFFEGDWETEDIPSGETFLKGSWKIERTPLVENFSVTATKGNVIRSVISFLFFFVLWVLMFWARDELELFYQITLTLMMLFFLSDMAAILLWKVTLDYHTLTFRNSFGIVKTYEIRQITEIIEERDHIILYMGRQKIVKISKDLQNFNYLLERLSNIPHISK
ncbi:MAG: hypothetical protein HDR30_06665 [Lachnospiraceae bacterium]|nr:hypothetical protein [Lachnospiraceae bacterium]